MVTQLSNLVHWITLSLLGTFFIFYFVETPVKDKFTWEIYWFALIVSLTFKKTDAQWIDFASEEH